MWCRAPIWRQWSTRFFAVYERDTSNISYANNGVRVEIIPSAIGSAMGFDKDILMDCISKLVGHEERRPSHRPRARLTTHETPGRRPTAPTNNLGYQRGDRRPCLLEVLLMTENH